MSFDAASARLGRLDWSWAEPFRHVWKTWLATRILTLGAVGLGAAIGGQALSRTWHGYDAGWFLHIAGNGYGERADAPAFFPAYPLVVRYAGETFADHYVLAAFLVSLPLTLVAFALVYAFARCHVREDQALRAVAYVALFPTAFFFHAVYSDGLFLVFAAGTFLAAERRSFVVAGALAGASMLTRPEGFAVALALVVFAFLEPERRSALARLWLAIPVFALYPVMLMADDRHPFAFVGVESHWRATSFHESVRGPYLALHSAWTGLRQLAGGYDYVALLNVTAFAVLVGFGLLSLLAWRRLGAPYGVYCLVSLAMPVFRPADPWPLVSIQRFALALFPCFVVLAALPLRRWQHRALLASSGALLVFLAVEWSHGRFVA